MMKRSKTFILINLSIIGLIGGCGEREATNYPQVVVWSGKPGEAKYSSTLQQGIDFRKEGYPDFLVEVSGMSGLEPWGRWSDATFGSSAKFRFRQPLPKKFKLSMTVSSLQEAHTAILRAGSSEREVVLGAHSTPMTYETDMETDGSVDALEIIAKKPFTPHEINPNSSDTRKLGVNLIELKIFN